jgi:GNAT superfamily N-acetyltransferase
LPSGLSVRHRVDADLAGVTRMAAAVQDLDGYPGRRPRDLRAFMQAPDARRRRGVGRALLETAAADARRRGCHPILDVATHYDAAIALYRACGWQDAGPVAMIFDDGFELRSYVYVAP